MVLAQIDRTRMMTTIQLGWMIVLLISAVSPWAAAQQAAPPPKDESESVLKLAKEHMDRFEMSRGGER